MSMDAIDALKAALEAGDWTKTHRLLSERAMREPECSLHWSNLASAASRLGLDPVPALRRAILLAPAETGPLNDLGALEPNGMTSAGRLHVLDPLHGPAILMCALRAFGEERQGDARRLLTGLRLSEPGNIEAGFLLAGTLEQAEQRDAAIKLYRTGQILAPEDALGAGRAMARLGAGPVSAAFPPAHVRRLFDGYAENFDTHLTERLNYTAPETLRRLALTCGAVTEHTQVPSAVDIGCGTGLSGAAFRPYCKHLTGIDISGEMVRRAEEKKLYDRLLTGEATDILRQEATTYRLIIAADVTSYIGDLSAFFAALSIRLDDDGTLLLTAVEPEPGEAPGIGPDGAHTYDLALLEQCAGKTGLHLQTHERGAMREEAGRPLATLFLAFTKLRQTRV